MAEVQQQQQQQQQALQSTQKVTDVIRNYRPTKVRAGISSHQLWAAPNKLSVNTRRSERPSTMPPST